MSEPVTNAEVEDVLSSIRRLVSEDKRPKINAMPVPETPVINTAVPETGKLVLTAALRVAEPVERVADIPQGRGDSVLRLDDSVAVAPPPEQAQPEERRETVPVQPAVLDGGFDRDDEDYSTNIAWETEVSQPRRDAAESAQDAQQTTDRAWQAAQIARTADESDSSPRVGAPSEPDVSSGMIDDAPADGWFQDLQDAEITEPAADDVTADAPLVTETAKAASLATLGEKIAAVEAALDQRTEDWEPEEPADVIARAADPGVMAWEDAVDLDATGAPMQNATPPKTRTPEPAARPKIAQAPFIDVPDEDDSEAMDDAFAAAALEAEMAEIEDAIEDSVENRALGALGDAPYLDEEALREMVGEIVRAELQGALGERITRNVRKLVRREIHRALAAHNLD